MWHCMKRKFHVKTFNNKLEVICMYCFLHQGRELMRCCVLTSYGHYGAKRTAFLDKLNVRNVVMFPNCFWPSSVQTTHTTDFFSEKKNFFLRVPATTFWRNSSSVFLDHHIHFSVWKIHLRVCLFTQNPPALIPDAIKPLKKSVRGSAGSRWMDR